MNFYIAVIGYLASVGLLTELVALDLKNAMIIRLFGFMDVTNIGLFGCFLAMGLLTLKYDWGLAPYFLRKSLNIKEVKEC